MKRRGLAAYLAAILAGQVGLYAGWLRAPEGSAFYFDPRIGLFVLEDTLRSDSLHAPGVLSWVSVGWLGLVIVALVCKSFGKRFYQASECVLALPSVVFFAVVLFAHMSPAHGFSIGELTFPVGVFLAFTVVPFVWSFRLPKDDHPWSVRRVV